MKKLFVVLALCAVVALAGWFSLKRSAPPEVAFARVQRMTLESTLATNGKVEPVAWAAARAEREGVVQTIHVERGQRVAQGAPLASLDAREAEAEQASAQARIAQARGEIETIERGGRVAEVAEIESGLNKARFDRDTAKRELEILERLVAKNAATRQEAVDAREKIERADLAINALEQRRASLIGKNDFAVAQARLRDAEAAAELARRRMALAVVRAPMSGIVYQLESRAGAWLSPGAAVAYVGRLERVKVVVYVDEPELGRVKTGMPVAITWDALPGRRWSGIVDKVPTQVTPLGTRQVGEVQCSIDNPGLDLLPGTNINAEIRSQVVANALTIPKEAIRRESAATGVFILAGERVGWRKVRLGASSVTRSVVEEGLAEGDSVALSADRPLRDGQPVRALFP